MKVYFHASVGQREKYGSYYDRIMRRLKKLGHEVDATHVMQHEMEWLKLQDDDLLLANKGYEELMRRIQKAELVVMEISYPSSVVVGHALTRALERGKPVLALYHAGTTASLIRGLEHERLIVSEYSSENLEEIIDFEIQQLSSLPDQRFTMLMPGDLMSYLDEIAESGLSRSEFIRNLLRAEMGKK